MVLYIQVLFYFCIEAYRPSQQFFSHVGTEPTLPVFNQHCRELMCLAQGHITMPSVGIKPGTSRFGVRHSTTTPLRSLSIKYFNTMTNQQILNRCEIVYGVKEIKSIICMYF